MQNNSFRCKLAVHAMISLLLLSLIICFSSMIIPTKLTKSSGVVYASPGVPVYNAMVMAYGPNGYGFATTNPSGQYSIATGLLTGTYTVQVVAPGYLVAKKENVAVTAGQETSNINFYLSASGGISGRVTDAVSGAPLKSIMVVAFPSSGSEEYGWTAITDANGYYSIITNLNTGTYNVSVIFPEGYVPKTTGGIAVTAALEVKGINFALDRSGIISGRITATPSGVPLLNATVMATSEDGKYFGYGQTNVTGHYRISSGLGTGKYMVMATSGTSYGFIMDINVVAGAETKNVDIAIAVSPPPPSGTITGKVTDSSGNPIADALVTADGPAGHGVAHTDKNGNYIIASGLGTGTYTVTASAPGYNDAQISGIRVTVNQVTSNVNFQLTPIPPAQSGRISGTVQGDENVIPEFQSPLIILLATTAYILILTKVLRTKAKRYERIHP